MKGGEGISQGTHTHDPQTQTAGSVGTTGGWGGQGLGGGRQRGGMGTSVIVSTIEIKKISYLF